MPGVMGPICIHFHDEIRPKFQRPLKAGHSCGAPASFPPAVQEVNPGVTLGQVGSPPPRPVGRIVVNHQHFKDSRGPQ